MHDVDGENARAAALRIGLAGARAGLTSILLWVLFGTYISIGALAHGLDFSILWAVLSTLLVWAGPAQVILISTLGAGGGPLEAGVAVGLSAIRLLPMVVTLMPIVRTKTTRWPSLVAIAHFTAVTMWIESLRLLPARPPHERAPFAIGLGIALLGTSTIATIIGWYLALSIPKLLVAGLLFLTPMSFLVSMIAGARSLADKLAVAVGLVLAPLLAWYGVGLDLLWTGLVGGTLAYAVDRRRRRV